MISVLTLVASRGFLLASFTKVIPAEMHQLVMYTINVVTVALGYSIVLLIGFSARRLTVTEYFERTKHGRGPLGLIRYFKLAVDYDPTDGLDTANNSI
jgi:hypothetical protein